MSEVEIVKLTHEEFVALVRDMRRAQKDYFRSKNLAVLEESKRLEKRVDQVIRDGGQLVLFG